MNDLTYNEVILLSRNKTIKKILPLLTLRITLENERLKLVAEPLTKVEHSPKVVFTRVKMSSREAPTRPKTHPPGWAGSSGRGWEFWAGREFRAGPGVQGGAGSSGRGRESRAGLGAVRAARERFILPV